MVENKKVYCKPCDKYYASRQSFYKHNKRFHSNIINSTTKLPQKTKNDYKNYTKFTQKSENLHKKYTKFYCERCEKYFSRNDSLKRHQKKCDGNNQSYDEIKKELDNLKSDLLKLMNRKCKIHPKTLAKMCRDNNITIDNTINDNSVNDNSVNTTNTITNSNINSNNTINIISLGNEDIPYVLSKKEQISILNNGYMSVNELVKYIHFNDDYPQFQNIAITNLNNPYAYQFDDKLNKYVVCKKEDLIKNVIEFRMIDIDDFYKKYGDKLSDKMRHIIQDLINRLDDDEPKILNEKKEQIKIMLYNNSNKEIVES